MKPQKFLQKKAYSISDAVKYILLNHDITISEKDLLEYIQNGDLQASVYLDGGLRKVESINRKELDVNNPLGVKKEGIFLQFSHSESNAKITHNKDFETINIKINNIYFDLTIILNDYYYLESYFDENDVIKLYTGELDKFNNLLFCGYFPLSSEMFEKYNVAELYDQGFIDEFDDIRMNLDEHFYFHLPFEENRTPLYLDDVVILHKDMIEFLELFSVIDIESKQDELQKLKEQLTSKNSELANLYKQIESKNKEVSGKSETSYLNIIQALKDELLKTGNFKNQTELISYLSEYYDGYQGLTESNLRDKFAKANNIK
ncbi:SlyX protein [Pasteurella multocida]|nr:SlyX protein [Pasteurella multocida]